MRLTIINQYYAPDIAPTGQLAASLAEHRAQQGDDVTIVASRGGYVKQSRADARSEREGNPSVCRMWTPQLGKKNVLTRCIDYASFYFGALCKMVFLPRQDAIISLTTPPYIAWAAVVHRIIHPGAKIVLWNMDCYPELAERSDKLRANGVAARIMRFMNRTLFGRLDHLVCLDSAMVELLMSQYTPADRELPVSVVPNWEPADAYPADASPEPWSKRADLGIDEGDFVLLYMGNMGYGHQFDTVLDAAEQLRDEPVKFLFVGGGSRYEAVEADAKQRNLANVIMHPYVLAEDVASVKAAADCALITLRDCILGVMSPSKLHSNLAMHLPVVYIGPEGSNVDDAIRDHHCGVSLRHGDVDSLVDVIRQMAAGDNEDMRMWSTNARRAFENAYCSTATLPQFDAIINGLVATEGSLSRVAQHPTGPARDTC